MMPKTINGMDAFDVMSTMQKAIRRGEERLAMHCACELGHTSKAFFSMALNRLTIIMHEDIGIADVEAVIFSTLTIEQARSMYKGPGKHGGWRMLIGNVIRVLSRSAKSREGDHFQAAVGGGAELQGLPPTIPDYAYDKHTRKGRKLGRGLEHFRKSSAKLVPDPGPDIYEDEAYEAWAMEDSGKKPPAPSPEGSNSDRLF